MTDRTHADLEAKLVQWQAMNTTGGAEADALLREIMIAAKALAGTDPLAEARKALAGLEDGKAETIRAALESIDVPAEAVAARVNNDWKQPGPVTEWLVQGWLPKGRIALFSGEGGQGKSKLALMLAAGMAGKPEDPNWLVSGPKLASHGAVVFATWEDSRDDIRWRLCDWPRAQKDNRRTTLPALLGDRLTVMDCARAGPAWAPREDGSRHTSTLGVLTPTGAAIRAEAEAREARLLVLDPLAAAFACNENDRGIVRSFMADWDGWARATGCTVLLIAHPPKSEAEYSGSTDWYGAARAVWTLGLKDLPKKEGQKREGKATQFACVKSNYGKKPDPLQLDNWKWWFASAWGQEMRNGKPEGRSAGKDDDDMYGDDMYRGW